jgi:hypothetical protein
MFMDASCREPDGTSIFNEAKPAGELQDVSLPPSRLQTMFLVTFPD